jgi:hypothetical protein
VMGNSRRYSRLVEGDRDRNHWHTLRE